MSSKNSGNAFYHFMLEFKEKHGRKFKSLSEVPAAASPHWNNMSKAQRQKYEDMAKAAKGALRASKLNCDNQPVDEVENLERQELIMKQNMRDEIQGTLAVAKGTNMLDTHMFYIVHVNSFCQHEHTKLYNPCEIAIAGFSLKDGVLPENVYHSMIKSGPLPLGYASMAQIHSNETHQIELPLGGQAEDNQGVVFKEIYEFLSSRNRDRSSTFPILYAAERNLSMVNSVFDMWCSDFGKNRSAFQIFNLQCMFRILRNMVAGSDEFWASDTMSHQEIEKDVYTYTDGIACEYHQMADSLVFCSRSIVIRYAYVICDHCCNDAGFELIPGYHVPGNARIPGKSDWKTKSSKKSNYSKSTSDGSVRDDTDTETVISLGKSSSGWGETSSMTSFNFPELKKPSGNNTMSGNSFFGKNSNENRNPSGSYAGATSMRGDGTRGTDPTLALSEEFGNLTSQDTLDNHFPAIGSSGGRARQFMKGTGRGNPFKKTPNAS